MRASCGVLYSANKKIEINLHQKTNEGAFSQLSLCKLSLAPSYSFIYGIISQSYSRRNMAGNIADTA